MTIATFVWWLQKETQAVKRLNAHRIK